jgi:diguanylate cyclase (GGDEF)-like protein
MVAQAQHWNTFVEASLIAVLEATDEGFLVFDHHRCRMASRRVGELLGMEPMLQVGRPREEVLGDMARCFEEPLVFVELMGRLSEGRPPEDFGDVDLRFPRPRRLTLRSFPILHAGMTHGHVLLLRDRSREGSLERQVKQLEAQLRQVTTVDPLTKAVTSRRFEEELLREHARCFRAWDSYGVLAFDVEGMGEINATSGRNAGDAVLEQVASQLAKGKRHYDVLGRGEEDSFWLLVPGADALGLRATAQRLAAAVKASEFPPSVGKGVSLKFGESLWLPPSPQGPLDVLQRARQGVA